MHQIVDRRAGDRGFPDVVMTDEPRRHVAAVRPSRNGDPIVIDLRALLQRGDSRHHIASRSGAGIVVDGVLVLVAEVVAAAIVRGEDDPAARGHRLRRETERSRGRRLRAAVYQKHERIFFRCVEVGRVDDDAIFIEAVVLPRDPFDFAKVARRDLVVVRRQSPRLCIDRRHVIQLARMLRLTAGERDRAVAADVHVDPERPRRTDVAEVELARGATDGLEPE